MPQYYSPGVYIEEVDKGPQPIEGLATAVAAFVGFAPYSSPEDANRPVLITSWTQYVERFGLPDKFGRRNPHMKDAYLSHAVYGYFQNGGSRCYVVRVVPGDPEAFRKLNPEKDAIQVPSSKDKNVPALTIRPLSRSIPKDIQITIGPKPGSAPGGGEFTVRVRMGDEEEEHKVVSLSDSSQGATTSGLSSQPSAGDGEGGSSAEQAQPSGTPDKGKKPEGSGGQAPRPKDLKDLLGGNSKFVQVLEHVGEDRARHMPAFGTYFITVPQPDAAALASIGAPTVIGDVTRRSGVEGLEIASDVTMVCCPDLMSPIFHGNKNLAEIKKDDNAALRIEAVQKAMIAHAELAGDRMAILDTPYDHDAQAVASWRLRVGYDSMYAAMYYPWISIANPLAEVNGQPQTIDVPPCGHIAGVFARNDATRGVHKAPANEIIRGALRPVKELTTGEQDGLNPIGVNCIRSFPGRSAVVWGARTMAVTRPAWRYVNVRRLFNYVEKSIERGTQWVVFEPNDPDLWSRVRRDVSAFLMTLWRDGMLFGATPQQAFYVKCDEELNPQESRDQGRLIIEVGLAPVKPAEFVIFRFSQIAGGGA